MNSTARRVNPDSTIDVICTKCYQTIARGKHETDCGDEVEHACVPLEELHAHLVPIDAAIPWK